MKRKITYFLFLVAALSFAQPPAGYYNIATGTGYELKTQLHVIITNNYNDRGYSGLYTTYLTSDRDYYYENNGTLLDMYTENPNGAECEFTYGINQDDGSSGTAECQKYNREHLVPQSVFGSQTPMYSDAHFVVPSDKYVNAQRDSFPFSRVNAASNTYTNGSKKGNNLNSGYSAGYSGTVFEPIDEFKGDIARMLLYFATRYEDQVAGWNYSMFNNTTNQVFTSQAINVLLTWNNNDPISQRERDRNNAIYARQNNRNPFIDNPNYAMQIWGSLLNTNSFEALSKVIISPNPSNSGNIIITTTALLDKISITTINGQLLQQINKPLLLDSKFEMSNLPKGFYFITLEANSQTSTKKVIIN
jgi:endonuclease I